MRCSLAAVQELSELKNHGCYSGCRGKQEVCPALGTSGGGQQYQGTGELPRSREQLRGQPHTGAPALSLHPAHFRQAGPFPGPVPTVHGLILWAAPLEGTRPQPWARARAALPWGYRPQASL